MGRTIPESQGIFQMAATAFTRLVGCSLPLQSAPMRGISTPELVAAVANAGGLGMVATPLRSPEGLLRTLDRITSLTNGVVGASFLIPFLDSEGLDVAAARARVVEFFYGEPDPELVQRAARNGALVAWQVGSRDEGERAVAAGCHFLIAQGTGAGGHVRGTIGLLPLLAELLDTVDVPVLAAGGIGTSRDVAAVLAAGASGVRIGTRLIAAAESGAHPTYVEALIRARAEDTVLTQRFSVMWADAPHRVLRSCVDAAEQLREYVAGEVTWDGLKIAIPRFSVIAPSRETVGSVHAMALYAGESVTAIRRVQSVPEIIRELMPS
jgi:NAD(P)H-dependent flavin oxidoreductase YrpB (nitropropane dioxygenase family)